MEFNRHAPEFEDAGYRLAALSVDAPHRSAALRTRLQLRFPLLCDSERAAVTAWDLNNPRERGGIAVPATVVIDRDGRVQRFEREAMSSRLPPKDLLAWLRGAPGAPRRRRLWPGWRDWWRAIQHLRSPRTPT